MFDLDLTFTNEFDEMLARMQGEDQRIKMKKLFEATPEELGKAAVDVALQTDRS
jgi:hypothetical protein